MASVDWSARPDQIESLALREVGVRQGPFVNCYISDSRDVEICPDTRAVL